MRNSLKTLLLEKLRSESLVSGRNLSLPAEKVRKFAESLGIGDKDLLWMLKSLRESHEIDLDWEGTVKPIMSEPKVASPLYGNVENLYNFENAHIEKSAIGTNSHNLNNADLRSQLLDGAIAHITAALVQIDESLSRLQPEAQELVETSTSEAKGIVNDLQSIQRVGNTSVTRLEVIEKSTGILSKITDIGTKVVPHVPQAMVMLHHAWESVRQFMEHV